MTPENGRIRVGYRPSFLYEGMEDNAYLIFPVEWFTMDGESLPLGLIISSHFLVDMCIIDPSWRDFHRTRMKVGTQILWKEFVHIVARGEVTELLELNDGISQ